MTGSGSVGQVLFFVLFVVRGSFAEQIEKRDLVGIGGQENATSERFPFFTDRVPIKTDVKDHMYLRLQVTRKIAKGETKQNETKLIYIQSHPYISD